MSPLYVYTCGPGLPAEISRPLESVPCYGRADPLYTLCLLPRELLVHTCQWRFI